MPSGAGVKNDSFEERKGKTMNALHLLFVLGSGMLVGSEEQKLTAINGRMGDVFGEALAIDGERAVIGAIGFDRNRAKYMQDHGAAYVFQRSGTVWAQEAKLKASDGKVWDELGAAVDISGDTVVASAPYHDLGGLKDVGAVYVFVRQGSVWSEQSKLVPSAPIQGQRFGDVVSLDGDTLLVSSIGESVVFVRNGSVWSEQTRLAVLGGPSVLSLDGERAVLGGWNGAEHTLHVFERAGTAWSEVDVVAFSITPMTYSQLPYGGWPQNASLDGDVAVVGSASSDASVYVFSKGSAGWGLETTLFPTRPVAVNYIASVALEGNHLAVGIRDALNGPGTVNLFVRTGTVWAETDIFEPLIEVANDDFASPVGLSGGVVLAAASGDSELGATAGAVYSFAVQEVDAVAYCTAGVSSGGCRALLSAVGSASATAVSGFELHATGVDGAKDGLFFFGTSGRQAQPFGGTSLQCVAPPVSRLGALAGSGTLGACDGAFVLDLNALWNPTGPLAHKNPGAGVLVQAQLIHRSGGGTILSDALEFLTGP